MEFPIAYGLSKTGLPLILSEDNVCFIIDTGATNNTLFHLVYENFKDKLKVLDDTLTVIGIDGVKHETPIIEATFNFGGEDYTSSFSVLDATDAVMTVQEESGIQIHGVLGTSFFVENKWVIDFKTCVVRED